MVPWIPLRTFSGGPADVVNAHNDWIKQDAMNPGCHGTLPPITATHLQVLEHLVIALNEKDLADFPFPEAVLDAHARTKGASAIMNLRTEEVKYKGFWLWKKPIYMRISGDAVKINYENRGEN